MTQKEFLDQAIPLLEEIQNTPTLLAWCRNFSFYDLNHDQPELDEALTRMTDDAYATGLVIKDYWDVIHNTGMDEYAVCTAAPAWLDTLNRKQTLAAIAYLFRRNRFVEGSLINHSVASGALLRLFRHLRSFEESASEQP